MEEADFDNFTNISLTTPDYNETYFRQDDTPLMVFCKSVFVLSVTCGILANVVTIYILIKCGKLTAHPNLYILSWCICNAVFLFGLPPAVISEWYNCIVMDGLFVFLAGNLIFVIILFFDWYITTYSSQVCAANCRSLLKIMTFATWVLIFVFMLSTVFLCAFETFFPIVGLFVLFSVLFVLVLSVVVQVLRLIKWKTSDVIVIKSYLTLTLVSSYVLCWLPNWGYTIFFIAIHSVLYEEIVCITMALGCLNSVVLLFLLCHYETNFNKTFKRMYRFRTSGEEDEEDYRNGVDLDSHGHLLM